MKRSRINQVIKDMEALAKENGFHLPPFCSWTPEEWAEKGHECDETVSYTHLDVYKRQEEEDSGRIGEKDRIIVRKRILCILFP